MQQKLKWLLIMHCIFCFKTTAQTVPSFICKQYNIPEKEIIYEEDFSDTSKYWSDNLTGEDTISDKYAEIVTSDTIENGYLKCTNRDDTGIWAEPHFLQIDYSKNFEVEISAKIQSTANRKKWSIVLFLGRDKNRRAQFFYISSSKRADLIYTKDSSHWRRPKLEHGLAFNFYKDEFNKITFRKINDHYYMFVNEKFVKKYDYNPISGHIIGLGAGESSEVWYDYIKVYRLPDSFSEASVTEHL